MKLHRQLSQLIKRSQTTSSGKLIIKTSRKGWSLFIYLIVKRTLLCYHIESFVKEGETLIKSAAFKQGIKDGIPICLGYLSVSFAFGIFCIEQGLTVLEALLISMTCVTSAGQLAAVPIMASCGSLIELALAQIIINLRYSLMSISLSQKLDETFNARRRCAISFMVTDEIFGVASSQDGKPPKEYFYGLMLTPWFGWATGTLVGAAAGNILPEIVITALAVAIYGMFVAIVVPPARDNRNVLYCVLTAIALSCIFAFVPFLKVVQSGFVIIICSVVASALFAYLKPIGEGERS